MFIQLTSAKSHPGMSDDPGNTVTLCLTHLARPWMQPARSLVITPSSTVSTHTFSKVWQKLQGDDAGPQIRMHKYSGHVK